MRLSLVAKQINVGTSTILQFLAAAGHKVDSNPNAKLNFEQLTLVAKEYDAPQILESQEPAKKVEEIVVPVVEAPKVEAPAEPEVKPEPVVEKSPAPVEAEKPGLKVLGKIDLDARGLPVKPKPAPPVVPKEEEKAPELKPEPIKEEVVKPEETQEVASPLAEVAVEAPAPLDEIELIKAKGKELKGLTVLGKIELPGTADRGAADRRHKRKRIVKDDKRAASSTEGGLANRDDANKKKNDAGKKTSGQRWS